MNGFKKMLIKHIVKKKVQNVMKKVREASENLERDLKKFDRRIPVKIKSR